MGPPPGRGQAGARIAIGLVSKVSFFVAATGEGSFRKNPVSKPVVTFDKVRRLQVGLGGRRIGVDSVEKEARSTPGIESYMERVAVRFPHRRMARLGLHGCGELFRICFFYNKSRGDGKQWISPFWFVSRRREIRPSETPIESTGLPRRQVWKQDGWSTVFYPEADRFRSSAICSGPSVR